MTTASKSMTVDKIVDHLHKKIPDLDEEVLENFQKNKIDWSVFINDEYLWELCPLLVSHIKVRKLVRKHRSENFLC